jgi:hypothetical protein
VQDMDPPPKSLSDRAKMLTSRAWGFPYHETMDEVHPLPTEDRNFCVKGTGECVDGLPLLPRLRD